VKLFNIILLGLLVSCGSNSIKVDPLLQPYEDWYFNLVNKSCNPRQYVNRNDYSIQFVDKIDGTLIIGQCRMYPFVTRREIIISMEWWDHMPEIYKKTLLAHELTHCFFNEQHTTDVNHFMYPELRYFMNTEELETQLSEYFKGECRVR